MSGMKRSHDGKEKRKHMSLTILQKVEILKKLDAGSSVKFLAASFGISERTVYDIKKNKEKLLSFYAESDSNAGIEKRKTMHKAKSMDLDNILYEWFKQRRSEGVPITGPLLCEKAKELHQQLNISEECNFTSGWLTKFKNRHGIRYMKAWGEKLSADSQAAEEFSDEFSMFVKDENLSPEQIYNMDETGLFWRCLPRNTFVTSDESCPSAVKEAKDRVTVVVCSNAAGTHKCKLMLISKSAHPRALKGIKTLPVIYKNNKKAWITRDLTIEWIENDFAKEARSHCNKVGLPKDCKIVLLLDNCAAHPEVVTKNNIIIYFLPPNTTSLIQPMDQGIIQNIKHNYKTEFLRRLIAVSSSFDSIDEARKNFNLKDCIFLLAEAWNCVSQNTLVHAWHRLWPASLFIDTESDISEEFEGFNSSAAVKAKTAELLLFAQNSSAAGAEVFNEQSLTDWIEKEDDDAEIIQTVTDEEIISSVLCPNIRCPSDTESEDEVEKVTLEEGFKLGEQYLKFLEKQNFVTEQEVMSVYRLQDKIVKHKAKHLKQTRIDSLFAACKDKRSS